MYSAVLMLALTAGSETADFGRNRCHGSAAGCSAPVAVAYSCSAVACSGGGHERHRLFGNRSHGCSASYGCSTTVVASCSSGCHERHRLFGNRSHVVPQSFVPEKKMMPGEPLPKPKEEKKKVSLSSPATIVVSLPADARLTVDGASTNSASARRTLITPELAVGVTYVYTMRAEIVRDGRTVAMDQQVTVRGGETSTIEFQFASQGVASR
jgi:uncharacterized protein (TIGR03000 family)